MALESTNDWTIRNLTTKFGEKEFTVTFDHYKNGNYRCSVEFTISPEEYETDFDRMKIEASNQAKADWLLEQEALNG